MLIEAFQTEASKEPHTTYNLICAQESFASAGFASYFELKCKT